MAKPTDAQIKALEKAHKNLLVALLQAIAIRKAVYAKLGKDSPEWKKYADLVWRMWSNWYKRQLKYEASGAAKKEGLLPDDYVSVEGQKRLKALAAKWDQQGEGIGFIPLLIWAVVAIVGFFTADQIVDELNTTTEEQGELIETTNKYCKDQNLSKEECQKFMTDQNTAVASPDTGMGTITKLFLFAGLGFAGYKILTHEKQH